MARRPIGTPTDPWAQIQRRPPSLIDFGIIIGHVSAAIGLAFIGFFLLVELVLGDFAGADSAIGIGLSLGILVFGVAIATVLWVGREIAGAGTVVVERVRSR